MRQDLGADAARGVIAGIFIGGAGSRMGGCAKGLLEVPGGGTLVERWLALLRGAGVARLLLVGRRAGYEGLGLDAIDDEPSGIGPIGGLAGLLRRSGDSRALALACDMPFVTPAIVAGLLSAPDAPIVAPRSEGLWEPLCARYDAKRVLPHVLRRIGAGQHALQPLLREAGAIELAVPREEATTLRDWDTPEDVRRA